VSRQRLNEIEDFFISYNKVEGRQFKPLARRGAERAHELLEKANRGSGAGANGARRSGGRAKKSGSR